MKHYFQAFAIISVLALSSGCASKNHEMEGATSSDSTSTVTEDTAAVLAPSEDSTHTDTSSTQSKTESVSGKVQEITNGKDGYTAKILTSDNHTYFVTISIPNLRENAKQYRTVKVGETINVTGDSWKMGNEDHITVRELH